MLAQSLEGEDVEEDGRQGRASDAYCAVGLEAQRRGLRRAQKVRQSFLSHSAIERSVYNLGRV